jgi:methionine synthase II (cobalamin-independent)
VTGYHQVFPAVGVAGCSDLTGLDAKELAWGRQEQAALDAAVKQAVQRYDFAQFVPIDFSGHELCTADSWVQGTTGREPYHPTAAGQAAYAKQVAEALK